MSKQVSSHYSAEVIDEFCSGESCPITGAPSVLPQKNWTIPSPPTTLAAWIVLPNDWHAVGSSFPVDLPISISDPPLERLRVFRI